jgi:hypothetical protein
MVYNYVRFGNVLEFGHNYLPEFMRMPAGQFGTEYFKPNYENLMKEIPKLSVEGLSFNRFGFAFWVANVLFVLTAAALLFCAFHNVKSLYQKKSYSRKTVNVFKDIKEGFVPEVVILTVLMIFHIVFLLLHKTLGGWQFGSRYTVDLLPAALTAAGFALKPIFSEKNSDDSYEKIKAPAGALAMVLLVSGSILNICGALMMF